MQYNDILDLKVCQPTLMMECKVFLAVMFATALPVRCSTNWAMKPHIGSKYTARNPSFG